MSLNANDFKMLNRLRSGPLSTRQAEHFLHRGQAVIGRLKEYGFDIDTQNGDTYVLRREPSELRIDVTSEIRDAYYSTQHWKTIAKARKQMDGFSCLQCKTSVGLETHHWCYYLFEEHLNDLATLCAICHDMVHEYAKGSRVMHFPRTLSQEMVNRIMRAAK